MKIVTTSKNRLIMRLALAVFLLSSALIVFGFMPGAKAYAADQEPQTDVVQAEESNGSVSENDQAEEEVVADEVAYAAAPEEEVVADEVAYAAAPEEEVVADEVANAAAPEEEVVADEVANAAAPEEEAVADEAALASTDSDPETTAADEAQNDEQAAANEEAQPQTVTPKTTAAASNAAENNEKEITLYVDSLVRGLGQPMKYYTYTLKQVDKNGNTVKNIELSKVNDYRWKATVLYDPVNGTRFALSEGTSNADYTSNFDSVLTEGAHYFTLIDENGNPVSKPDDSDFEYGDVATDNTADSIISMNPANDKSIDEMFALNYETLSDSSAIFSVYHGINKQKVEARDYTLELTIGKEVVGEADADREYQFTVMPLFGYAIDAKTRYNIAVPGEQKSDRGGRFSDAKVYTVWLNSPTGNDLVDEEWLATNLKYILQLTVPAHTGEYWKEKVWESIVSQSEKTNMADAGFGGLMYKEDFNWKEGIVTYENIEYLVKNINKNTQNFYKVNGDHLLQSMEKLEALIKKQGYNSLREYLYNGWNTREETTFSEFVELLRKAGVTQDDMIFLRVMSQNGFTGEGGVVESDSSIGELTAQAYAEVLGEDNEILKYFAGETFTLKAGETITFKIPNKVALDEVGGLLITEKQSDDYTSSGSISTYFLVAPESVKDGGTWSTTETVVNTFEPTDIVSDEPGNTVVPKEPEDNEKVEEKTETPVKEEVETVTVKKPEASSTTKDTPAVQSVYEIEDDDVVKTADASSANNTVKTADATSNSSSPATGDNTSLFTLVMMILLAATMLAAIIRRRVRN